MSHSMTRATTDAMTRAKTDAMTRATANCVARIGLKRIAVPVPSAARPAVHRGTIGRAQPCDLSVWSAGLYGVFLPDRRTARDPIGFTDRRG